jgi:hypothetical protein
MTLNKKSRKNTQYLRWGMVSVSSVYVVLPVKVAGAISAVESGWSASPRPDNPRGDGGCFASPEML